MVLVFGLFLGLGALSLWPVVLLSARRLVLGARHLLGAVLGELAPYWFLLWLGAAAARGAFCGWAGVLLRGRAGWPLVRLFHWRRVLYFFPLWQFLLSS